MKRVTSFYFFLSLFHSLLIPLVGTTVSAQEIEDMKKGVVRITSTVDGNRKVGTGIIIQLKSDGVYIVTASHVVEGAQNVSVEFFVKRNQPVPAKVIGMEGDDPNGLAALLVAGNIPQRLMALNLTPSLPVVGGDSVTTLGFPRLSMVPWAVITGNVVGQTGKNITISGPVDEGNSGGPLIKEGRVIGMITQVIDNFAYAVPTIIMEYVLKGWGINFDQPAASQTQATANSFPETTDGLKTYFQTMLREAKFGDRQFAEQLCNDLIIPNYESWFEDIFGPINGGRLAADYAMILKKTMREGTLLDLDKLADRSKDGISVLRLVDPEDFNATGGQKKVLTAMKKPIPLYSVRLGGLHIWSFVFVDGNFRLAGKMYHALR